MKIVINQKYGGFGLSKEAYEFLGLEWDGYGFDMDENRADPKLVECVETLGERVNGVCAGLKVLDIPDDVEWEIQEYGGREWIAEKHRTWE